MPQQANISVEANFSGGLKTEFTGLNFPENSSTDALNCIFNRIGNVNRRLGIDFETNFTQTTIDRTNLAISNYKWKNVGGDGSTQVLVQQVGGTLHFYRSSSATTASPLSTTKLASTVALSSFVVSGSSVDTTLECQYTDGNGYLFVLHPSCEPFYCTYNAGTIAGVRIDVKVRDFEGITEAGVVDDFRPVTLTGNHTYNIQNQGWVNKAGWSATSTTSNNTNLGAHTWTVEAGLSITNGDTVNITAVSDDSKGTITLTATVTSYASPMLVLNVLTSDKAGFNSSNWTFSHPTVSYSTTFATATNVYPANSDVWWRYKKDDGTFDPATTIDKVTIRAAPAPKGHFVLSAFNMDRTNVSSIIGITNVTTTVRPRTGAWFQGRVWYAGVDASFPSSGSASNWSWSESLYFSQIVERADQFGRCYQINDPTDEDLFDILPSDGGVIRIQGCGPIYKLFPIQNGLLVFAANGVWFITGSQGIGFAANDYVIIKLSSIQSISGTSFVDVQGFPMWWNEEGIYSIGIGDGGAPNGASRGAAPSGSLQVQPMTYTTIQSFYQSIPLSSKKYVRGDYDYLNWEVRWVYKSTEAANVTARYSFDSILTFNTTTQAFSPWALDNAGGPTQPSIHGVAFIQAPGGSAAPDPIIKYICSNAVNGQYKFTFAEEKSTSYVDWHSSGTDYNFSSYFLTGYKIKGQAQHKFQSNYIYVFSNNDVNTSYRLQGIWDYAISGNSGKFTNLQRTDIDENVSHFAVVRRRHRVRGRGLVLQYKITSVDGAPFDIIGWSIDERINAGV